MAVINVQPKLTSAPEDARERERGDLEVSITWVVTTDDPNDGPLTVLAAPGLPAMHAHYAIGNDVNTSLTVRERNPNRTANNRQVWEVECVYSSRTDTADFADPNPFARPPQVSWTTQPFQAVAKYDLYGTPLTNVINEEFDPPYMADDMRLTLSYTRNEATNDIPFIFSYRNTVNSDQFAGFAPGEAKMAGIEASRHVENKIVYWETTYTIQFKNRVVDPQSKVYLHMGNAWEQIGFVPPWNATLLNVGFHERVNVAGGSQIVRFRDKRGSAVPNPQRLNIGGYRLEDKPTADSTFLSYAIYQEKPYAALGMNL